MKAPDFHLRLKSLWLALGFCATAAACYLAFKASGLQILEAAYREPVALTLHAYMTKEEPDDIVILGSSRVEYGLYAPAIEKRLNKDGTRDLRVFKLGFGGLRPYLMSKVLRDAILPKPPRKLLVIGIEERLFTRAVAARSREKLGIKRGDVLAGEWDLDAIVASTPEYLRGVKNFWYLEWLMREKTQEISAFQREHGGEYLTFEDRTARDDRHRNWAQTRGQTPYTPAGAIWRWGGDEAANEGFERLLDDLEKVQVPVIFISMPIRKDLQEELADDRKRFQELIVPRVRERGHAYFDLNRWNGVVRVNDFLDAHHLYLTGTRKVSSRFVDDILIPQLERAERVARKPGG